MGKHQQSDSQLSVDDISEGSSYIATKKSIKKDEKKDKPTREKQDQIQREREIYEEDDPLEEDFELSDFQSQYRALSEPGSVQQQPVYNYVLQKPEKKLKSPPKNQQNSQMKGQDSANDYDTDEILNLLMMWVNFFNTIGQPNGLVFKAEFRKTLNKLHNKSGRKFDEEHQLDPEKEQIPKIKAEVQKLLIFIKKYHRCNMSNEEFQEYIKKDIQKITQIFKESSYIFCREVTLELYNILRKLCNIVLEYSNQFEIVDQKRRCVMNRKLREFGERVAKQEVVKKQQQKGQTKEEKDDYFFFGFQFVKFPQGKSQKELEELEKKEKYKFALKSQFRKGKEFADFMEKAGLHLYDHLRKLNCFKSFNMAY